MTVSEELRKENELLKDNLKSLHNILSAKTSVLKGEIHKKVIHQSMDVVVELTNMKESSENKVEDTPFHSELYLIDGEIDVEHNDKRTNLKDSNRVVKLPKGTNAKGLAKKDSAIITVIDIKS